jgi:beta-1,2-mannobiose phosphorylase / 1,2-beta-oligomannan phosphorylase
MDLATRFPQNPLLRPADLKPGIEGMEITCLLNPGVFRFDGKIWLLLRVAERPKQIEGKISFPVYNSKGGIEILSFDKNDPDLDASDPRVINYKKKDYLTTLSYLRLVCSEDGISFHEAEGYPPIFGKGELETFGIEDCRVATMTEGFILSFTEVSEFGVGVGLIRTKDWKNFSREGMIFPPHNKDCAIFEEKINGKYYALHRPSSPELGGNYIWLAESPDLIHWGQHKCIAVVRPDSWDSARVGAGGAPIRTEKGWLEIYHGANKRSSLLPSGPCCSTSTTRQKYLPAVQNPSWSPHKSMNKPDFSEMWFSPTDTTWRATIFSSTTAPATKSSVAPGSQSGKYLLQ